MQKEKKGQRECEGIGKYPKNEEGMEQSSFLEGEERGGEATESLYNNEGV